MPWPASPACAALVVGIEQMLLNYGFSKGLKIKLNYLKLLVGARGFEPPTSCSQGRRANQAALRPDKWDTAVVISQIV